MSTRLPDPRAQAIQQLARARDPADVVVALGTALNGLAEGGSSIDLVVGEHRVPFVSHTRRDLTALMRIARAREPIEASELAMAARRQPIVSGIGKRNDPLERVRLALRAETVTVFALTIGDGVIGYVALYGRRLSEDAQRFAELLALAAAATIDRLVTKHTARSAVAVRDATIAMLTSLSERSPVPTVFLDRELRVVASNDAFAAHQGETHETLFRRDLAELDFTGLANIRQTIREVFTTGEAIVRDGYAVHPVENGAGVGITLIDVRARKRTEHLARGLAEASVVLSSATTVRATRAAITDLAARWLGTHVAMVDGDRVPATTFGALLSSLPDEMSHLRAQRNAVVFAVSSDDLAIFALSNEMVRVASASLDVRALLFIPIGGSVVCVGRREPDYSGEELAFAADVARLASRALESSSAREEVRSWSELFTDFLTMVSRDLRDPITALIARLYVAEHSEDPAPHLQQLRHNAERLRDVAQRLGDVAPRPPAEVRDLVDVNALIDAESRFAQSTAETKGARIVIDSQRVPPVDGDARRLGDALRDVFAHVAMSVPSGGIFCIRVEAAEHEIRISVSHNGIGMSLAEARRAFDGMWDGRTDARALTVARAVFAAHGGRSWVETAPDAGTAYCFTLPLETNVSSVA